MTGDRPDVSVVIPAKDEAGNLPGLVTEIGTALSGRPFEVLVVDDGSTDETDRVLADMTASSAPWLRHIRHAESCGQSASIRTGVRYARGDVIVTIDGDGQNDPRFIPEMLAAMEAGGDGVAMVAGERQGRKASWGKRYGSRAANGLRRTLLNDGTRDTGCGLKAIRREVFLELPYFDGWHRYLPALVKREGGGVRYVDVVDRERQFGASHYGLWDRAAVGILDLFGVWWLMRRRRRIQSPKEMRSDGQ
ncbi:dolichol-phosphate mannosyltransferase [Amorphus suaedae]